MEGLLVYAGFFALGCLVTFLVLSFLGRGTPENEEGVWESWTNEDGALVYAWKDYMVLQAPDPTMLNRVVNAAGMEKPVDRFVWIGTDQDAEIARDESLMAVLQTCEVLESMRKKQNGLENDD